jgi:NitT/TauT family transport system substrate-binding protein
MASKKTMWYSIALIGVLGAMFLAVYRTGPERVDNKPKADVSPSLMGRPLRVGIVEWPGYAGGIVANNGFRANRDSTFWKDHSLEVEFVLVPDDDVLKKQFAKGDIDIKWTTVDSWASELPAIHESFKAKAFLQVDWSRGGDAIVATEQIRSIEDLKGKKIALTMFTPSQWLLENKLMSSRLSEEDRESLLRSAVGSKGSDDARISFIAAGENPSVQIDAAVMWEPDVTLALKRKGSHVLASTALDQNLIADLMVAKVDFIQRNPKVIQAFVNGWLKGSELAEKDKNRVAELLIANEPVYKSLGLSETLRQLGTVKWADKQDNSTMFGLTGQKPMFDDMYLSAAQLWLKRGVIKKIVPPEEARDTTFVREALGSK